jgi:hypothetical protein
MKPNPSPECGRKENTMSKHMSEAEITLATTLSGMGVEITTGWPSGGVDKVEGKDGKAWPHITYTATLARNGREFFSGPYKLGVGHVEIPKEQRHETPFRMLPPEKQAQRAAHLAVSQCVKPTLAGVMSSILMDGSAFFDGQTFEDWCGNYGYETDSRKAEALFRTCDDIGRKIARAFTGEELAKLREMGAEL